MLTHRSHKERQLTGSQPVAGALCLGGGWQKASSQGYALVIGYTASVNDRTPAIGFPMNPEVGR